MMAGRRGQHKEVNLRLRFRLGVMRGFQIFRIECYNEIDFCLC